MIIKWLGHSCFRIDENGESVIFDPFKDGSVAGLRDIRETASMVLVSHMHGDHNGVENVELVEENFEVFKPEAIETYHDDKNGKLRGKNLIHVVTVDDYFKVVHMGDIGCDLTSDQLAKIKRCDVLFIPVGGYFTIGPRKAAEMVKLINPRITIPMHYKGEGFGYDVLKPVEEFTKYFDKVLYLTTDTVETSDELDGEIVVLDYAI